MRNQNIGQPFTFLRTRTLNEGQPREHVDNSTSIEKRGQKIPQLRVLLWDSFLHFLLLYKDCGEKLGNQPSLPLTTLGKSFDCLFMSILGLIYFLLTFIFFYIFFIKGFTLFMWFHSFQLKLFIAKISLIFSLLNTFCKISSYTYLEL